MLAALYATQCQLTHRYVLQGVAAGRCETYHSVGSSRCEECSGHVVGYYTVQHGVQE